MNVAKTWWVAGCVLGASQLGLAAWHAHGLTDSLSAEDYAATARALEHQFRATAGLLLLALATRRCHTLLGVLAGTGFLLSVALFSGSIWLRALSGNADWTQVAPAGGSIGILAWLLLALAGLMGPAEGWSRRPDLNRG